jgi:hypothetical protein
VEFHPQLVADGSYYKLKLGRRPLRPAPRALAFADYLDPGVVATLPDAVDGLAETLPWPLHANDVIADAPCAAAGHLLGAWAAASGSEDAPAEGAVEACYWETGEPRSSSGSPGSQSDNGRTSIAVLEHWASAGIGGERIVAFARIGRGDIDELHAAIALLGGAYLGIALPLSAQAQAVWDVIGDGESGNARAGSWGGHAVAAVGYEVAGLDTISVVTWGAAVQATRRFVEAYVDEAYAVLSPVWLEARGGAIEGLDVARLRHDFAAAYPPGSADEEEETSRAAWDFLRAAVLRWSAPRETARSIHWTSVRCSASTASLSPSATAVASRLVSVLIVER